MTNLKIREQILRNGLRHWEVADQLGIGDATFCRWLRKDLSPEREKKVLQAIEELVKKRKGEQRKWEKDFWEELF